MGVVSGQGIDKQVVECYLHLEKRDFGISVCNNVGVTKSIDLLTHVHTLLVVQSAPIMHSDNVSTSAGESRDRKATKPLMEKRRRARINASLAELKSLLLEVIRREGARHSKMEKADILEMTVKHLRDMQRQSFAAAAANDPTLIDKQKLGYSECTQEVSRYLSNIEGCDVELRTRLLDHLANFVSGLDPSSSPSPPVTSFSATPSPSATPLSLLPGSSSAYAASQDQPQVPQVRTPLVYPSSSDVNNNIAILPPPQSVQPSQVVSGLQVIPAQLQTGEIAFVLPGSSTGSSQVPNYIIPVYTSPSTLSMKPTVTVASGRTNLGSVMAIVPSADVFQKCTLPPGNINIISQPVSSSIRTASPSSTVTTAMLSMSPDHRSDSDVTYINEPHHSQEDKQTGQHSSTELGGVRYKEERSAIRYENVRDLSEERHRDAIGIYEGRLYDHRTLTGRHRDMIELGEVRHEVTSSCGVRHEVTGDLGARRRHGSREFVEVRSPSVGDLREVRRHDTEDSGVVRHEFIGLCYGRHQNLRGLSEVRRHDAGVSGGVRPEVIGPGDERHQNGRDLSEVRCHDVRNPDEVRQHVATDLGEERHRDVREIPDARHHDDRELHQEQDGGTSMWRPW